MMASHPRQLRRANRQRGFSLIELIVAFALMALVLTTVLAIAARAYRQVAWSGSAMEASQWAQTLSDEAAGQTLALGRSEGRVQDGRYRWVREVSEYRDPDNLLRDVDGRARLWQTRLEVHWDDGQRDNVIRLIGLRPAPVPKAGPMP